MLKKIVFMGTPFFSVPILKSLYQNGYPISVVYTQPPQKSNRGLKLNKSPIQGMSETLNINFRTPTFLKNNEVEYDYFKKLDADLAIVVAYGQIIPKEFLNLTKKGFINIHASLLPLWRGAAPIQRSIMNLEKETGVTIMKIEEKLDTGPICNSYRIEINKNDNTETLSEKLSLLSAKKILENIDNIFEDKIEFKDQNHKKATYAFKIEKSEGKINWNDCAENILGKINGLYPNPGAWFSYKGERYKILKAEIGTGSGKFGEVINNYIEIMCNNKKSIKILEIQRQGKRTQKINEFIPGSQIKKGLNLSDA
jgi:methionyl-tRNA formyltransferase|tara:strand:+ start:147 stop:1079 length:933 start_codon:yes stop_codon:yes gene_type:complete